ncbi:hypothetical protein HMPREF1979_03282, partial [Actinomyces johnsonii F0542]
MPGSSPLARGLLRVRSPLIECSGIIPARAGFTPERLSVSVRPRDHPRSRGVYSGAQDVVAVDWGSSPLARG